MTTASTAAHAATLGAEDFVLLTTFRRNGEGVPTPVWISHLADQARGLATRRKGLTYRDTVVLISPAAHSSEREEAHDG